MEKKEEIRRRILEIRSRQGGREWKSGTDRIMKKVTAHPWFLEAEAVYCYVDVRGEAGTRGIMDYAWRLGKRVFVPSVKGHDMEFYRLFSFDGLKEGTFGIPEPSVKIRERKADIKRDGRIFMIMPGVAFDRERNRIGYGGGYYDRYLASCTEFYGHAIAIAFECQIVEKIEAEKTDRKPELLITERRIL